MGNERAFSEGRAEPAVEPVGERLPLASLFSVCQKTPLSELHFLAVTIHHTFRGQLQPNFVQEDASDRSGWGDWLVDRPDLRDAAIEAPVPVSLGSSGSKAGSVGNDRRRSGGVSSAVVSWRPAPAVAGAAPGGAGSCLASTFQRNHAARSPWGGVGADSGREFSQGLQRVRSPDLRTAGWCRLMGRELLGFFPLAGGSGCVVNLPLVAPFNSSLSSSRMRLFRL